MVRALKFLVILMGVVLVVGFTVVAVEVVRRAGGSDTGTERTALRTLPTEAPGGRAMPGPAPTGVVPPAAVTQPPFEARIDLPAGARTGTAVATADRVVVPVILPEGGLILYSLDPVTGETAGTIHMTGR